MGNNLVEIKGKHLYDKMLIPNTFDNAKLRCMLDNNVTILLDCDCKAYVKYCEEKYGKNFNKKYKNIMEEHLN